MSNLFSKLLVRGFVIVIAVIWAGTALAAPSSPREYVSELAQTAHGVIESGNQVETDREFTAQFDMPRFSKRCLIDHWDSLTLGQQKRFIEIFSQTLRKKLREIAEHHAGNKVFKYKVGKPVYDKDGIIKVPMMVDASGDEIKVVYFLVRTAMGSYRLLDYEIAGALLSRNYRGQFNFLMRKHGFDGMISRVKKKRKSSLAFSVSNL